MTNIDSPLSPAADRFGRKVAARLSAGTAELPYEVRERLRAARVQAVARRKVEMRPALPAIRMGGAVALGFGDDRLGLWNRIASVVPLIVLAFGLVLITSIQNDRRASEVAEVDVAILTDELPPAAYADPGFAQFLRLNAE
jgi:hypothetical protein